MSAGLDPTAASTGRSRSVTIASPSSPRSGAPSPSSRHSPFGPGRLFGSSPPSQQPGLSSASPAGLLTRHPTVGDRVSPLQLSTPPSKRRVRTLSFGQAMDTSTSSAASARSGNATNSIPPASPNSPSGRNLLHDTAAKAQARDAQRVNDSMVYLDGPQVYACAQCRTHLTSHDDIISKSFHGRHGRAYLFDQCVNVTIGPAEDRWLITGLHSVCDIFCKRCKSLIGWTYKRAYETSQKYKEGKYIIEKINLHLEESGSYDVAPPAGEKCDRWRKRSMSWGSDSGGRNSPLVFEYALPGVSPSALAAPPPSVSLSSSSSDAASTTNTTMHL